MKKYIFLLILIIPFNIFAQEVKNVQFRQQGDKVIITYDLIANKRGYFNVTAFYTTDNGKTFIPLKSTTGDIGKDINPKKNRKIVWNVLDDTDGIINNIRFKITADYYIPKIEGHFIGNFTIYATELGGSGSLNFGWFKSPTKKTGMLLSGNLYYNSRRYDYNSSCCPSYLDGGINFGLMHKLINNPKFQLICYGQAALNRCDIYVFGKSESVAGYYTFPFPVSTGLIFNTHHFDILTGIKILNNNKLIENFKELNIGDLPPAYSCGFSLGIGKTF